MKAFHGTSIKNAIAILSGDTEKECGIWNVSDCDGAFYFYPLNKVCESEGGEFDECDSDELEEYAARAVEMAKWHAQAATCHAPTDQTGYVVLEMEIPDDLMQDDYSCENMADQASYIDLEDLDKVQFVKIHVGSLSVYHRPFVLCGLADNPHFTDSELDPALVAMAQAVSGTDAACNILDDLACVDLDAVTKEEFLSQYAK